MKKFLAKLLNWEGPRGTHKPSAEEIFQREQKTASENAREEEARRKANIEEGRWQEAQIPEGQEGQSGK